MPIKKIPNSLPKTSFGRPVLKEVEQNNEKNCQNSHRCRGSFGRKIVLTLVAVFLVYMIVYVGVLSRNVLKKFDYIGRADTLEKTITITGVGESTGNNDIAMITIGFSNTAKDVSKAQLDNKKVMDAVMKELVSMEIEDKDTKTSYNVYPDYNYTPDEGRVLEGYKVTNQLTVKIRDLSKISDVIALAGKHKANKISGLSFTIDDSENLKNEARQKALIDAKNKAKMLSDSLGVKLGSVISFSEYDSNSGGYYPVRAYSEGSLMGFDNNSPAKIAGGSQEIKMNVSITYEILSR